MSDDSERRDPGPTSQQASAAAEDQGPTVPASVRWTVLVVISLAMFGNYYVYDSISPLADILKSQLHFSDSNIGLLNGIYSLPNIIMVLIGGLIIDRIGTKASALLFSALCLAGAALTTFSQGHLWVMASGRLVFGLGAESLIVAITTTLAKWFKGKELSLAFGLNLTIARLGSVAAINSPTWAAKLYGYWQYPLLVSTAMAVLSVLAVLAYIGTDTAARRRYELPPEEKQDKVSLRQMAGLPRSYWYVTILCVTFYSAMFPFQTFAVKFFMEHHGLSRQWAGFSSSVINIASMIGTPLFGYLIDRKGRRASLMILGSAMIVPVYLVMAYLPLHPIFMTAVMGVAFSLVPAAMWPSVALLVEEKRLGTAYGLMTMIQNAGLTLFNLLVGRVNDAFATPALTDKIAHTVSSGPFAGTSSLVTAPPVINYVPGMWLFSTTGFIGLVFAYLLLREDHGPNSPGLERPAPKE